MWRKGITTFIVCLRTIVLPAQSHEDIERILRLTGRDSAEELSGHEVEVFQEYLERPLRINSEGIGRLRSCGLLSAYQAASLADYRARHGDILSMNELSSVDGFTRESAAVLAPFITLEGGVLSSGNTSASKGYYCDIAVKGGIRRNEGNYGLKAKGGIGRRVTYSLGLSRSYSAKSAAPEHLTGNLGWESRKIPLRITAGRYNLRFGQGLALWNGMSMGGLSKISSFYRSGTGLSSSWSFTGSNAFTGIAGEYNRARFRATSSVSFSKGSVLPAVNLGWFGRNMSVSATHYIEFKRGSDTGRTFIPDMKTAADIAACINGTDIFSEIAFDWVSCTAAALAGTTFPAGEKIRMALHLRYYPSGYNPAYSAAPRSGSRCSDELGASWCMELAKGSGRQGGSISLDGALMPAGKSEAGKGLQFKGVAAWEFGISEAITLRLRLSERYRTWERRLRTDLRADLTWTGKRFTASSRINVLKHIRTGFLAYVEGGWKSEKLSVFVKTGVYIVDEWEDRIYSYERNSPGNFSVPAFYGRGAWTTIYTAWKFSKRGKVYVIGTVKPGKAELKLQVNLSIS